MADAALWIAVGTMVGVYVLIATERTHRTTATLLGVAVLLASQFIVGSFWAPARIWSAEPRPGRSEAAVLFEEITSAIDLNVILLLFGMMVIVAVTARTRVFQYLAYRMYKAARGRPGRLLMFLCLFTAFTSAWIDNVTTMLLVTPVTLELAAVLGTNPVLFLLPQVFASNIGGAFTLVGDPPNILAGSYADLTFMEFIEGLTPSVGVAFAVFMVYVWFRYGKGLQREGDPEAAATEAHLQERYTVTSWRDVAVCLFVLGGVVLLFLLHGALHMEVAVPALMGAAVLVVVSRHDVVEIVEEVEWPTLLFFMTLFIIVDAVNVTGGLSIVAHAIAGMADGNLVLVIVLLIWVSAIASAVVDNIPFAATMLPVVGALTAEGGDFAGVEGLWWALLFGVDLGGNATVVGASANIVTVGIAERAGHRISFGTFMRHGVPVAIITCLVGSVVLLLEWAL